MIPIKPSLNKSRKFMVAKTSKILLSNGDTMYIPASFLMDYASIPTLLKFFFNHIGVYRDAFICHDWFYWYGGYFTDSKLQNFVAVSRRFSDREMWYQMTKMGSEKWRADLYYKAVKWFGWLSFLK
jgi:hypothetical protein